MSEILDQRSLEILEDVLEKTHDSTIGLNIKRYRIDHEKDLDRLDYLTNKRLIQMDRNQSTMRIGYMGLVFVRNGTREALINDIDRILDQLREQYRKTLDEPVALTDISKKIKLPRARVDSCVDLIQSCFSIGHLLAEDAKVFPSEYLHRVRNFEDFISARALEWFPQLSKKEPTKIKPHGNTEIHAKKREEVLGAAITAIISWPDKCKNGSAYSGTKIATLIDQKAQLWWSEGTAPLSIDIMARLINQYLKPPE
jgi:hypothetical protein